MITAFEVIRQIQFCKVLAQLYRRDTLFYPYAISLWKYFKLGIDYRTSSKYQEIDHLQSSIFAYESRLFKERGVMIL